MKVKCHIVTQALRQHANMASSNSSGSTDSEKQKSLVTVLKELGIKPINQENLLYYYCPGLGACSYAALSVNVMNPNLVVKLFPKRDMTNVLLLSALLGSGLYIYNRSHLRRAPSNMHITCSTFGALMFNFGSVLAWAVLRSVLPDSTVLCTLVGLGSGVILIKSGKNYLNFIDSQISN